MTRSQKKKHHPSTVATFSLLDAFVWVERTEEKGSDVNLATYLLVDGYDGNYEEAIVVSSDSDLSEPIRIVTQRLGLPVHVLNPSLDQNNRAAELQKVASSYKRIRQGTLRACQFPPTMQDGQGTFTKPAKW